MDEEDYRGGRDARTRALRKFWSVLPALVVVFLIILVIALGVQISAKSKRLKAEKAAALKHDRPAVNVVLLDVAPHPIRDRLNLPAIVEPWVELDIRSEVSGAVEAIPLKEGTAVRKGTLIARVDPRDYRNALDAAEAQYGEARKSHERLKPLHEQELIPDAEFDKTESALKSLKAQRDNAALMLERTEIRAPFSGVIDRLDIEQGLYLKPYDPVAHLLDIGRVKVVVGIPESDVSEVRKIRKFPVTIDALDGKTFEGRPYFLSRSPETQAHLYRLEIAVDNPRGEILPGMFAKADIVKRQVEEALSVPLYAVITRDSEQYVYVEEDGVAKRRMVETGILEGWQVQVTKGLASGDRVVVVGHRSVGEGQALNVIRTVSDPEELFR